MLTYTKQGLSLGDLKDMGREIVLVNFQLLFKNVQGEKSAFLSSSSLAGFYSQR